MAIICSTVFHLARALLTLVTGYDYLRAGLRHIGRAAESEPRSAEESQWWEEFEAAARRPLKERFKYAFIKTYKPVMDDEPFRAFDTMEDYRRWCEENLPDWLGYGRV